MACSFSDELTEGQAMSEKDQRARTIELAMTKATALVVQSSNRWITHQEDDPACPTDRLDVASVLEARLRFDLWVMREQLERGAFEVVQQFVAQTEGHIRLFAQTLDNGERYREIYIAMRHLSELKDHLDTLVTLSPTT